MKKFDLKKEEAILLVIDIQERLASIMDDKDSVVNNTKTLIEASKLLDFPLIITEQYPKGLGSTLVELTENIDNPETYEKSSFNAYLEDIKEAIDSKYRKKIIIAGMETHICVMQTARELIGAGYQVFVVEDAVCSRTVENSKNGLDQMREMGAVITNTESVVFDLLKVSGTPEFKALSQMIK